VLTEVPIAVTVECSYNQLGAFFEKLGQLPRIVSLNEFKFTGIERPTHRACRDDAGDLCVPARGRSAAAQAGAPAPAPAPPPAAGPPGTPR